VIPAVRGQTPQEPVQLAPRSFAPEELAQVDLQEILEVVFDFFPVVLDEEYEG
jgi:hypothetical protein